MPSGDGTAEGLAAALSSEISGAEKIANLQEELAATTDIRKQQAIIQQIEVERVKLTGDIADNMALAAKHANVNEAAKAWDDIFGATMGISDSLVKNSKVLKLFKGGTDGLADSFQRTFTASNIAMASISKVIDASIALTFEQEAASVAFNINTGAMRMYGDQMLELNQDMFHHGVSVEDAGAAYGALQAEMGQLNNMAKTDQVELAQTAAVLEHMGVAAGTTAGNMHFLTAAMGMTAHEAAVSQREMFALAQEVGMAPTKMAEDFASAQPQMAKFGAEGTEVFKKLAVNAKHAGMGVDQLLSITEKFDTFEGAAKSVGQLNAILGGPFLSSMQMVEATDPTERMRLLSGALNEAGSSFDDMAYYERIALTEAMGLKDVSELALVMRDGFDETVPAMAQSQEELAALAEQSKEFNTLKEEGIELMRMFALSFTPVIDALKSMAQWIQDLNAYTDGWLAPLGAIVIALGALAFVVGGALWAALTATSVAMPAAAAATALFSGAAVKAGDDVDDLAPKAAKAMQTMGKAATSAAGGMLAFGAAILMVGVGIATAAVGMALFVFSFSYLSAGQIVGAVIGLLALTAAFTAFGIVLALLVYSGTLPAAAIGLLAMGASFIMIGVGIAIAVAGLALLVYSFSLLFATLEVESLTSFVLALGGLILSMYLLTPLLPVLALLTAGLAGFAFAMSLIDITNIATLTMFFQSLSSVLDKDLEKLAKIEEAVKGISDAASAVDDTERLVAVRQIIEAVNGASSANTQSAVSAKGGGTGAGALGQPSHMCLFAYIYCT